MGSIVAFPLTALDYTGSFSTWSQQTFSSLPDEMKNLIGSIERSWDAKWKNTDCEKISSANDADEVLPGIWIGNYDSSQDPVFLAKNKITHVLNMAEECRYAPTTSNIKFFRIGIKDSALTGDGVFEKSADIIKKCLDEGENILVHCAAGVSRSSAAVVSHLVINKGWSVTGSIKSLESLRKVVNPHPLLIRSMIRDFGEKIS